MKMRQLLKGAMICGMGALVLTGCALEDTGSNTVSSGSFYDDGGSSTQNDSLAVVETISPNGFTVLWIKKSKGYGEVIYTDDLNKKRGNGYLLTSNVRGSFNLRCEKGRYDDMAISFSCKASNVNYTKYITLKKGVAYKWLVNYGFEHEKGEVEAVMTYMGDGKINIE